MFESSCTTKYVEKQPGKFVGDTGCEKLPVEICGAGCTFEEGPEECHDKVITSLVDVPEEICDLNPQKTCRFEVRRKGGRRGSINLTELFLDQARAQTGPKTRVHHRPPGDL